MSIVYWRCWKAAPVFHRGRNPCQRGTGVAQLCRLVRGSAQGHLLSWPWVPGQRFPPAEPRFPPWMQLPCCLSR